tara:strand:- start:6 stop:170 length:165 start_codon:yes stop_codon:yes gene_type:complete
MMSETIYKIRKRKDKIKERLTQLDNLFEIGVNSLNNKNNKQEKKLKKNGKNYWN